MISSYFNKLKFRVFLYALILRYKKVLLLVSVALNVFYTITNLKSKFFDVKLKVVHIHLHMLVKL